MAVFLARELKDGELLQVGVAMPVAEAAVRLAHSLHGPNMELIFLGTRMNVAHLDSLPMPAFGWDRRVVRWAESYSDTGHRFDRLRDWHKRVFFIGGVQIDPHGNTNLIGVGSEYTQLRFRGPGSVGTPTLSTHVGRYYIVLNSHTVRTFVERCDYISTVGWGSGGADARKKLGIPGGGPKYCVTRCASWTLPKTKSACGCAPCIRACRLSRSRTRPAFAWSYPSGSRPPNCPAPKSCTFCAAGSTRPESCAGRGAEHGKSSDQYGP